MKVSLVISITSPTLVSPIFAHAMASFSTSRVLLPVSGVPSWYQQLKNSRCLLTSSSVHGAPSSAVVPRSPSLLLSSFPSLFGVGGSNSPNAWYALRCTSDILVPLSSLYAHVLLVISSAVLPYTSCISFSHICIHACVWFRFIESVTSDAHSALSLLHKCSCPTPPSLCGWYAHFFVIGLYPPQRAVSISCCVSSTIIFASLGTCTLAW